jgi:hypothetical protein
MAIVEGELSAHEGCEEEWRKMREATRDMIERQSTLLVEIGGILVDSREVRK